MKTFDLISDLHLDFYVREYWRWGKDLGNKTEREIIKKFVDAIIPDDPSKVLVIAGDLGHKNSQVHILFEFLAQKYQNILYTFGNHDLYLFSDEDEHLYYMNSIDRWKEMVDVASNIPGVVALNGNKITIDNVTFGGTGLWYDYTYGFKLGYSRKKLDEYWYSFSDSNHVTDYPYFSEEIRKLDRIIDDCDVIVTHVSPDDSRVNPIYRSDPITSFFYFDGSEFISRARRKVWCYGHVHYRQMYVKEQCLFANNALGYPNEIPFTKAIAVSLDYTDYCYSTES